MKIKFWGVRGSLPSTISSVQWKSHISGLLKEFVQSGRTKIDDVDAFLNQKSIPDVGGYGVATTCVQVSNDGQNLIVDGGSGIKYLSDDWAQKKFPAKEHHILMTHFHFDHILGLPFFVPHFIKGHKIHYYAVQPECEKIVRSMFQKPVFPVPFESLQSEIIFHQIKPYETLKIAGFDVAAYQMDHPDLSYGFRITHNGKSYAHAVDHEAERRTRADLGQDAGLFEKASLMYIDAQYRESEMSHKKGWGHGTFDRAFEVCNNFNIQQVLLAHHDPSANIQDIQNLAQEAKIAQTTKFPNAKFKWQLAYEGLEIEL